MNEIFQWFVFPEMVSMQGWTKKIFPFKNPRILSIFFLGFSSGLPFLLILGTLSVWLAESHVSKTSIGILTWVSIPYSLKFLLAPFVDSIQIPFMCRYFGQRRGWILTTQIFLILFIILLGMSTPHETLSFTILWAFMVGIFSALQDAGIEAFRIESLPRKRLGYGASASVLGYRFGMLVSGAGALYLAAFFSSWMISYCIMALCLVIGMGAILLSREPQKSYPFKNTMDPKAISSGKDINHKELQKQGQENFSKILLLNFLKTKNWALILPFILFYKVGDTILNTMSMPFLIEIGFSKVEIAHVAKTFGLSAMVIGGVLGGIFLGRFSLRRALMLCTCLQISASLCFMVQAFLGYHTPFLFLTIGVENLACGMSQVALVAYLSTHATPPYTATQYALVASFGSFSRIFLSSCAGWVADHVTWPWFYVLVTIGGLPALWILLKWGGHFKVLPPSFPSLSTAKTI